MLGNSVNPSTEDFYMSVIGGLKNNLKQKKALESKVKTLRGQLLESQTLYVQMLEAQKLLATVSEDNTRITLDFITGMVNKVLAEIFPNAPCKIKMTKKLFAGSKPHVIVELIDAEGNILDTSDQCGDGLNQVISFMYVICLIEIRKGRRLLILDERLNGLHKAAKSIISSIIKIFVEGGFQFIFVEYSLNDIGKIYNVEKRGMEATVQSIDGEYSDDCVYISDVDLDSLDYEYSEEESVETTV